MPRRGAAERAAGYWEGPESRAGIEPRTLPALTPAELVAALSQGLDLAEGRPMGHAQRVCYVAASVADEVGLSSQLRVALYYASLFHDIGVPLASAGLSTIAGVSEDALFAASLLRPPEQLAVESTPAAYQAIVQAFHHHCALGAKAISDLGLPAEVTRIIAAHHENWDGGGYALAMEGDEIPLGARVFAVVDAYEAMTSHRPYRKALPHCKAIEEIVRNANAQFDPEVVRAFLEAEKRGLLDSERRQDAESRPASIDSLKRTLSPTAGD